VGRGDVVESSPNEGAMKLLLGLSVLLVLAVLLGAAASAEDNSEKLRPPVIQSAEMPLYPHLARIARIEGTARVEVTTDGIKIVKVTASGAHNLLLDAAQANIRTWHFYPHERQTFTVSYIYKLESQEVFGFVNPTVLLDLPSRVEIRTKMHPVETVESDKP
jgi:outer membrane biosynthesis protein TonB